MFHYREPINKQPERVEENRGYGEHVSSPRSSLPPVSTGAPGTLLRGVSSRSDEKKPRQLAGPRRAPRKQQPGETGEPLPGTPDPFFSLRPLAKLAYYISLFFFFLFFYRSTQFVLFRVELNLRPKMLTGSKTTFKVRQMLPDIKVSSPGTLAHLNGHLEKRLTSLNAV